MHRLFSSSALECKHHCNASGAAERKGFTSLQSSDIEVLCAIVHWQLHFRA